MPWQGLHLDLDLVFLFAFLTGAALLFLAVVLRTVFLFGAFFVLRAVFVLATAFFLAGFLFFAAVWADFFAFFTIFPPCAALRI